MTEAGLTLFVEVGGGVDVRGGVLDQLGFAPTIAEPLRRIEPRVYAPGLLGLASAGLGADSGAAASMAGAT